VGAPTAITVDLFFPLSLEGLMNQEWWGSQRGGPDTPPPQGPVGLLASVSLCPGWLVGAEKPARLEMFYFFQVPTPFEGVAAFTCSWGDARGETPPFFSQDLGMSFHSFSHVAVLGHFISGGWAGKKIVVFPSGFLGGLGGDFAVLCCFVLNFSGWGGYLARSLPKFRVFPPWFSSTFFSGTFSPGGAASPLWFPPF